MLEILVVLIAMLVMARKPRRKFRRYLRGTIDDQLAIGTLSTKDAAIAAMSGVVNERTYVSSVKATWALTDWTQTAADGPITVGVSHSDYTAAEIEEWIENSGGWNEGDLVAQEIAKRKIRLVGTFMTANSDLIGTALLADGRQITTKCGWILNQGQTLNVWAYNNGESAPATGSIVRVNGHANLWPR